MQQLTQWMRRVKGLVLRALRFCCVIALLLPLVAQALPPTYSTKVTPSPDTSYSDPRVNIQLSNGLKPPIKEEATLSIGECSYMGVLATRMCARLAVPIPDRHPGDKGYDRNNPENNKAKSNYGNNTGPEGNPRVQLCVYEDPCDGGDPPDGNCTINSSSPYHHNTPREMLEKKQDTLILAATTGTFLLATGGLGVVVAAPAVGIYFLVKAIMKNYNHVVISTRGCIDIPLGPSPPAWHHNLWKIPYVPNPDIAIATNVEASSLKLDKGVGFFDPAVIVKICQDKRMTDNVVLLPCADQNAVLKETLLLNPNLNNKYEECHDSTTVVENMPNRTFCARISTSRPNKVCVFKKADGANNFKDVQIVCLKRPGWMEKPTLSKIEDSRGAMGLKLSYPGYPSESINLTEDPNIPAGNDPDPAWTSNCGYLQQVRFCMLRPCKTMAEDGKSCTEYEPSLCVNGFDSPYGVVVRTSDNAIIAGTPNIKNTAYDGWIYNRPQCFQMDYATGACINYAGLPHGGECCSVTVTGQNGSSTNCPTVKGPYTDSEGQCLQYVPNVTSDPYVINANPILAGSAMAKSFCAGDNTKQGTITINPTTTENVDCRPLHSVRPLEPKEVGMCVDIPKSDGKLIKNGPLATTFYTVPENCGRIQVRLWAGGGTGYANDGGDGKDHSGGSGAYAKWQLAVSPKELITVTVGAAGGATGGSSSITRTTSTGLKETLLVPGGDGQAQSGKLVYPGGKLDKTSWRWYNNPCTEDISKKDSADCYITPQTRNGFDGERNGHHIRGPAGGNRPDWATDQQFIGPEDLDKPAATSTKYAGCPGIRLTSVDGLSNTTINKRTAACKDAIYIGCQWAGYTPTMRSEKTALMEEDTSWTLDTWPYLWPGAGGCSFDDPGNEPWGTGANGRVEIHCLNTGAVAGQRECVAQAYRFRTKNIDPGLKRQRYFNCALPLTPHGQRAPSTTCVEDTSAVPSQTPPLAERVDANPPMCQNGIWD